MRQSGALQPSMFHVGNEAGYQVHGPRGSLAHPDWRAAAWPPDTRIDAPLPGLQPRSAAQRNSLQYFGNMTKLHMFVPCTTRQLEARPNYAALHSQAAGSTSNLHV